MKRIYIICIVLAAWSRAYAQAPVNDDIDNAKTLTTIFGYCSADAEYSSAGATASNYGKGLFWNSPGKDVWFKFTAQRFDVSVTVSGKTASSSSTLINPLVAIYDYDPGSGQIMEANGSMKSFDNTTVAYRGALTIGHTYYIRVSAENDNTGTFMLCINNYTPPVKAGQDCSSASNLCSKEPISVQDISGAGNNNREAAGTCMGPEANSAWYTWTAATQGTLTFTISPVVDTDDIDWVLYDVGTSGSCSGITPANAIRCASGSGVNCSPRYNKTGMATGSTDFNEQPGCISTQDGFVQSIVMQPGHIYYLLIDNVSSGSGFNLEFGGTGEFIGPQAKIDFQRNNVCTPAQSYTFKSLSTSYTSLKWSFGDDADMQTATTEGPFTITYAKPGIKTVVLEALGDKGCVTVATQTFAVGLKPATPAITANKPDFCIKDTIRLSTAAVPGATYQWTGPDNFISDQRTVSIPVNSFDVAGTYSLSITVNECTSDVATVTIPPVLKNPTAAFTASPNPPAKLAYPVTVQFTNLSTDADTYLWDFGDGSTSAEVNPQHEYLTIGEFNVSLIAFKSDVCSASAMQGKFIIRSDNTIFIPNTFTPNGDGVNDEFVVTILNLRSYHIRIFNRWGEQLFESDDIFDNWKGIYKEGALPVGTYYYLVDAVNLKGNSIRRSGSVTIIR